MSINQGSAPAASATVNTQKIREALTDLINFETRRLSPDCDCIECKTARALVAKAKQALAARPRNCDRPECATSKAAQDVWRKEAGGRTAYYEWLLAPVDAKLAKCESEVAHA